MSKRKAWNQRVLFCLKEVIMVRADNVLNMQITIINCIRQEWNIDFCKISELLNKYDLLS